jgi:septum site-determining protein MinC
VIDTTESWFRAAIGAAIESRAYTLASMVFPPQGSKVPASSSAPAPSPPDIFVTETMAELSARQGRTADAVAIYRRLLDGAPAADERRAGWTARLAALASVADNAGAGHLSSSAAAGPRGIAGAATASPTIATSTAAAATPVPVPAPPALRMPLVVRQPVRSGQIVYAQHGDLIVLGPVNSGAQLLADGNIHVYGPLRGRAVAGVRGCAEAQIFCLRLEAELVGIDAAYLTSEELPPALFGQGARLWLEDGRCRVTRL